MTGRQNNSQWSGGIAAQTAPKFPSEKILWKILALICWDEDGILLIDYLPNGQNINAVYSSSLLAHLKDILRGKRQQCPGSPGTGTLKMVAYLGFQCLDHTSYSADLAPSDYHLFPRPKKQLKVSHFESARRSLLLRRPGWTDNLLIFFEWFAKVRATG
jgi:hypothetical protein